MIHSFLEYTIYRTPKADRQIQKIIKQYPTFQSVFEKTLKSFLAFPDTRQSWIKQLRDLYAQSKSFLYFYGSLGSIKIQSLFSFEGYESFSAEANIGSIDLMWNV